MTKRKRSLDFKQMLQDSWGEWEWRNHLVNHSMATPGLTKCCLNQKYSVQFFEKFTAWGIVEHLIIRRHDTKAIHSWYDLQRIKNELVGSDRTAVEVYPSESQLVDDENLYHLWVLPSGFELPFGLHGVLKEAIAQPGNGKGIGGEG